MYKVYIKKEAQKGIKKLASDDIPNVLKKLCTLEENPRPVGCKKLAKSANAYRIAKGVYRILYTVDDKRKSITVYRVGHRKQIYRRLSF